MAEADFSISEKSYEAGLLVIIEEAGKQGISKEDLLGKIGKRFLCSSEHCLLSLMERGKISARCVSVPQNETPAFPERVLTYFAEELRCG